MNDRIDKMTVLKVLMYFNVFLFLGLTNGCFFVSAGAYKKISITATMQSINFIIFGIVKYCVSIGNPINTNMEAIQQIQLLLACNPNDVNLKTLKNIKRSMVSFNVPSNNAHIKITIAFVIVI